MRNFWLVFVSFCFLGFSPPFFLSFCSHLLRVVDGAVIINVRMSVEQ